MRVSIRKPLNRTWRCPLACQQRGGIALFMLLVFMVMAVPLVLAATQVAGQLSRNSNVYETRLTTSYSKASDVEFSIAEILDPDALSVPDLLEDEGIIDRDTDGVDDIKITKVAPNVDLSGQGLVVSQKVVYDDPVPLDTPHTFTYTIVARNEGSGTVGLVELVNYLPPGLSYVADSTSVTVSQEPSPGVDLEAEPVTEAGTDSCSQTPQKVTWSFPWDPDPPTEPLDPSYFTDSHIRLGPQHKLTLTFEATGSFAGGTDGTFYNRASVDYRGWWDNFSTPNQSWTPYGAEFPVDTGADLVCGYDLFVLVEDTAGLVEELGEEVDIAYQIQIDNVSDIDLRLERVYDLLPPSYTYQEDTSVWDPDPAIGETEPALQEGDRDRLTWTLDPPYLLVSGDSITLEFLALGTVEAGVTYFNEASADFTSAELNGRADIVLALDNSLSICDDIIVPCGGGEVALTPLKETAHKVVDHFQLDTTGGNIRIGVTRFRGCSLPVADLTDDPDAIKEGDHPTTIGLYVEGGIGSSSSGSYETITVNDVARLTDFKTIVIDDEELYVSYADVENDLVYVVRGINGTDADSHDHEALVQLIDSQSCNDTYTSEDDFGVLDESGGIDESETTFDISDSSGLNGGDTIIIDGEQMYLSEIDGTDLTVLRQQNNTLGVAHADQQPVSIFLDGPDLGINYLEPGYDLSENTNILAALYGAMAHFQSGIGEQEDAPNSIIIISDFRDSFGLTEELVETVKEDIDAEIFAIGVGDYDSTILQAVASDEDHWFTTTDFNDLLDQIEDIVAGVPQVITTSGGASEATSASGGTFYDIESLDAEGNTRIRSRVLSRRDLYGNEKVEIWSWQECPGQPSCDS